MCESRNVSIVRVFSLILIACACCIACGCREGSESPAVISETSSVTGTVQLAIEFNSDRENINLNVPCDADSTVFTILELARNAGDLEFESTGRDDEFRFVTSIAGVDNLAAAGDNWVYRVNGKLGDKSAALYPVNSGDQVLWVFGKYSEGQ